MNKSEIDQSSSSKLPNVNHLAENSAEHKRRLRDELAILEQAGRLTRSNVCSVA